MTKEELLAGFLDRSLSEDAILQFQELRSADPAFAQQVQDMLTIENILPSAAPVVTAPPEFLASVENSLAAHVAAGAKTSLVGGLLQNVFTWVGVAGVAAVGVGTFYFTQLNTSTSTVKTVAPVEQPVQPRAENINAVNNQPASVEQRQVISGTTSNADHTPLRIEKRESVPAHAAPDLPTTVNSVPSESTPSAPIKADGAPPALEALVQKLDGCIAANKHRECSQIALQVGHQFMKASNPNSATKYYLIALDEARVSRIVTYQVSALGNLALASIENGRVANAKEYLNEAITLGTNNNVSVDGWKSTLNSLK